MTRCEYTMPNGEPKSPISSLAELLGVYLVYFFVSGWAFLDHYYRSFNLDLSSIDISVPDTLVRGLTVLFIDGPHVWLWIIYLIVLAAPFLLDWAPRRLYKWFALTVLSLLLIPIHHLSGTIGTTAGDRDKSKDSHLPAVTFLLKSDPSKRSYRGKLVLRKGESVFIHAAGPVDGPQPELQVAIYRADELEELMVVEPPKQR